MSVPGEGLRQSRSVSTGSSIIRTKPSSVIRGLWPELTMEKAALVL